MKSIYPAVLTAVIAVLGAADDQRIIAAIIAAAFLICTVIRISTESRILFMSAAGFPLVLTAGYAPAAGLLVFLLIITVLAGAETKLNWHHILAGLLAGAAGLLFALQISVFLPLLAIGIFIVILIYILFVREYRLKKYVEGTLK